MVKRLLGSGVHGWGVLRAARALRMLRALVAAVTVLCAVPVVAQAASTAPVQGASLPQPDWGARAHWLTHDLIAWPNMGEFGVIDLVVTDPVTRTTERRSLTRTGNVAGALATQHPHLAGAPLMQIDGATRKLAAAWLKNDVRLDVQVPGEDLRRTSGLQIGPVLDALFATDAPLGVTFERGKGGAPATPTLRLWAPTARGVQVSLFDGPRGGTPTVLPMQQDAATGVWSVTGTPDWNRKYYSFAVSVYVPAEGRVVVNTVTDPYSVSLSRDSGRSQIVNLDDADTKPAGWNALRTTLPAAPEDRAFYELHVRDFSASDPLVPATLRGTYDAFGVEGSNGMAHLRRLARAGLTDVHLLPTYDCATIPEDRAAQAQPPADLSRYPANSDRQQAALEPVLDKDAFNWCYDPLHYFVPEGSYSTNADGMPRIVAFRKMVMDLRRAGLGTVLDVVFNHTMAAGQQSASVLDRIVPGYFHRLDDKGAVTNSTCCANTASERRMMERMIVDGVALWARDYKVSGFRFDLMGHHSRDTLLRVRRRLDALTLSGDGVDGRNLYVYGEGWNFGEVANNARFVQASQINMGQGTGIGTFNDRIRDALRGGGVGDSGPGIAKAQGFASGLFTAPNAADRDAARDRANLLRLSDHIRVGMAGSIAGFAFQTADGSVQRADALRYGDAPVGYVSDPQETINYAEAHDNETLFDVLAHKLPRDVTPAERTRWQNLAASVVILSQGVPFLHAGQDMLRSKSLDRNSFNSGDWFNLLDFTQRTNGWGRGLPPRRGHGQDAAVEAALLGDPRIAVGPKDIRAASAHVREMLTIRRSTKLLRLRTGQEVIDQVRFLNTGPDQVPGLIVMQVNRGKLPALVVVVNATRAEQRVAAPGGRAFRLHPVQAESADATVRETYIAAGGALVTPPLTTSVFVAGRIK